jgi:hypothetical protein
MADPAEVKASLSKLEGALEEYLALGGDTPLASQADSWLGAVRQERDAMKGEPESPEEDQLEGGEASEEGDSSPSSFRDATAAARKTFGRNGNAGRDHGGSKTEDEEQTQDEEAKKKRTKAY